MCRFVLVFFGPFGVAVASLGGGGGGLVLVLFVRLFGLCFFGFVGFLFLLGVWEELRFEIVALLGLFSYFFLPLLDDVISAM